LLLAPEFYRPLRTLGASFHAGMAGREVLQRVAELRRTHPLIPSHLRPIRPRLGAKLASCAPHVLVDRVTFAYGAGGRVAVDEVTIDLAEGTTVALVGPSGSGKTTVASLILGFIEPAAGAVLVDGHPLASMPIATWRQRVAWVPQRPHLFCGTLLDNLRLARPGASREEVDRALSNAHASEFVAALPSGLETPIGERGARLSGGQAQRIALARAYLKDAPFLVLDEPTSQVDPETEASIRDAIARLRVGRTVLLIAHRLTTAAAADAVVVMEGGRVVATGSHDELMRDGGRYAAMARAFGGAL
jgi:ATP-binding cassette, subfamily C, bacterial CydD